MARYFLLSLVFALISTVTFGQTSLTGKVTDGETNEELIGANLSLYKDEVFITGAATDFDGNYSINVDPGTYDVEISYIGYQSNRINGVVVRAGQANKLDSKLGTGGSAVNLDEIVVIDYKVPLVDQDNTTQGAIVTGDDIRKFASKNINAVAASTAGLSQVDEGDALTVRGSRSNATDVYVDGIRVNASQVQEADVEQLQVITGGIPAYYGDVTGGIISITTKGPSKKFTGGVEAETSEFLDAFGYNQFRANVSGPILKKKGTDESIIGFRFSGAYTALQDDDPTAVDVYRVKDEKLKELEENPVLPIGLGIPSANFLTGDDVDRLKYRPNEESRNINVTGKIDARLTKSIDITLTGSYVDDQNKFTPDGGRTGSDNWRLMNSHNNPTTYTNRYRGNFRFRHRLGGGTNLNAEADEAAAKKSSFIQNAEYTLQFGYEKGIGESYDPRHEDRLFDYGHFGTFNYTSFPAFGPLPAGLEPGFGSDGNDNIGHTGFTDFFTGFDPSTAKNPVLANYNKAFEDNDLPLENNGIIPGTLQDTWSDLHTNVGQVYNRFNKNESDLYTANATVSFDILPGGSEKGRHSIQLGMLYEQRFTRNYTVNPRNLWVVAQQQANRQILGPDYDLNSVVDSLNLGPFLGFAPIFNTLIEDRPDLRFYKAVRELNLPDDPYLDGLHAYVNVNTLNPADLSLDMFSTTELTNTPNLIGFYGYDHKGNKLDNSVTFEDFFTARDADGIRSFLVPVNKPNYLAFFVQDKFTFRDIIFRFGLRVDRYDANTKVMKDPFSLYEIQSASEFETATGKAAPPAIGSDFKVYTTAAGSTTVKAYRDGETWYTAEGTAVNDGRLIFGGSPVFPRLKNESADIKDPDFLISDSFEDYEPQINWMPRLAFSFPISDAANFFAHYDVLVQRPPSNAIVSPLNYYYFYDRTPENNANLKPERTIDYEVGFQQKLSNSSAIKIAAYYKEMRDMIQLQNFAHVAVITDYLAYSNQDFGTVKGFSFQYDLRRTGNVSANINYTLQFADGTGSDPESARALARRGKIRNLYPLNFDERHRIVGSIDYRYATGTGYNGPRWFGKDIFADAGINVQTVAVSGRPYTAKLVSERFGGTGTVGSINGARKPWNFTVNMRADKSFNLAKAGKRGLNLNVYFRVQNLLDARNIVRLYEASNSADNDGYLASANGQTEVNNFDDIQSAAFVEAYSWAIQNPNNFSRPRRMYLGAVLNF